MSKEIKILIADDHPIFRRGLRAVVESDALLKVVAEVDNGADALSKIEEHEPDVAVLDINMPQADGLTVAKTIQEKNLPTVPVFLTMHADEAIFNAAIDADVKGFVIKDGAANDIVTCIKEVSSGRRFFSSALSEFLLNRRNANNSPLENLTASERRILRLLEGGKSTKEIAAELFVSPRTVDHHRANISAKLGLKGKNALLAFALNNKTKI
ncbi:MAG: response regulator transcription factor [Acidobacteriota bacterium]|nr:response regulator transcription factor [Acidobacteriota bacterium]